MKTNATYFVNDEKERDKKCFNACSFSPLKSTPKKQKNPLTNPIYGAIIPIIHFNA